MEGPAWSEDYRCFLTCRSCQFLLVTSYLFKCHHLQFHSSVPRLAICTKKGVYVFELVPDATRTTQKLSFEKTFLENDKEPNPWQLRCSVPESLLAR